MEQQDTTRTDPQKNGAHAAPDGEPRDPSTSAADNTQVGQVSRSLGNVTRQLPRTPAAPASTRRAETRAAQQVARERIATLIAALGDPSHALHQSACDDLVALGDAAVPALNEALSPNRPWLTAYRAAEALGQIGDGRAAGPLLEALRHPNSNVRWSAVRALAVVGDARALLELRRVARDDRGKTSWGEPVAGAARSALNQMQSQNILLRGADLIKTAVACVLMLVALIVAWKVVGDLRSQLKQVGLEAVDPSVLSAPAPTAAPQLLDLSQPTTEASPEPTAAPVVEATTAITGTVRATANVRALPQVGTGEVIGRISEGDEVVFLAVTPDGQWYRIQLGERHFASSRITSPNGDGWVNRSLLSQPDGTVPVEEVALPTAPPPADQANPTPTP
jgi:HEAT repeat protein